MRNMTSLELQTTAAVASPRPAASVCTSGSKRRIVGWPMGARRAITVPTFHDPWPLRSPT